MIACRNLIKPLLGLFFPLFFISANAQNQGPPPTVAHLIEGIGVVKSKLMTWVTKYDSSMVFKQEQDVNGFANFIGKDNYKGSLQLIGEEYKIVMVKWTYIFDDDKNYMTGLTNMGHFAALIGGLPCVDWLVEKIKEVRKNRQKAFIEDKVFFYDFANGEVRYDPTTLIMTLTFTPNKPEK